ncbi:MAG: 3-isopropylmalate/(R)-2-methylmalate dehydratase small subunit [Halieaceae bacterium]|jgi:3-isopropylmalate/(R)-2-methylmalate dehydratase small subunit
MSMEPFHSCTGVAAPMLRPNIDTDAVIPSREMKRVSKLGLGEGLFAGERYLSAETREPAPDFILNKPEFKGCCILLAGANFGCGSSREHAVWALKEFGVRAVVAPSFGAIFANNCVRNGLLPVTLTQALVEDVADWVLKAPQSNQVTIDLDSQRLEAGAINVSFEVDAGARHMLLNGLDAIALTLTRRDEIEGFDRKRRDSRPWLYQQ